MAATQPNLHQFFKARKSARDASNPKNTKNSTARDPYPKYDEVSALNVKDNTPNTELDGLEVRARHETKKKLFFANHSPTTHVRYLAKKPNRVKAPPSGTQDIVSVFERVAAKRKRSDEEEEDEATKKISSDSDHLNTIHVTPPVTPKRKQEENEEDRKKRRKPADKDGLDRTPSGPDDVLLHDAPKSAKKKLLMASEQSVQLKEPANEEENVNGSSRKIRSVKKLTPAEIKERLGKCDQIYTLRAKLLKMNNCGEKLKLFKEKTLVDNFQSRDVPSSPCKTVVHPQLEKFSALDVEVPVSPRKTSIKTPIKTPVKVPAHERFQHLVQKPSDELTMPYKYRFVKEIFHAVDTVVSLLHNRQEVITFSKLKSSVQEMLRKAFSERHLGEIKTVFPLAYFFKQEASKNAGRAVMVSEAKEPYQLTIAANLDYKFATQNLMSRFNADLDSQAPRYRKMDSLVMVERRNIFHNALINILREHHTEFLKSLDPPIINCDDTSIRRWHPEFLLDDIPDIEPSVLPQPPTTEKFNTAQDILTKAQDLFSVNPRLEKAVADAAAKTPTKVCEEKAPSQPTQPAIVIAALKGVSSSLLEKIRAREASKAARTMTRTTTENKELEMLSRLPEIARIIRNIFITEKKAALPWEAVALKVSASYPSMLAGSEVDTHLNLLIKEVPGWCTVHKVRSGVFLKINKNEPQSNITDKLQALIKQRR